MVIGERFPKSAPPTMDVVDHPKSPRPIVVVCRRNLMNGFRFSDVSLARTDAESMTGFSAHVLSTGRASSTATAYSSKLNAALCTRSLLQPSELLPLEPRIRSKQLKALQRNYSCRRSLFTNSPEIMSGSGRDRVQVEQREYEGR